MFPGPKASQLLDQLEIRLKAIPKSDYVSRLRAIALVRATSEEAWKPYANEVEQIRSTLSKAPVNSSSVRQYSAALEAFGAMSVEAPTSRLELFTPGNDEQRFLARVALGSAWAFSNEDQVLKHFQAVRNEAYARAKAPTEPVVAYLAGLAGLPGPGSRLTQSNFTEIGAALDAGLKGCSLNGSQTADLYRFRLDSKSDCSLAVTAAVYRSSFGPES